MKRRSFLRRSAATALLAGSAIADVIPRAPHEPPLLAVLPFEAIDASEESVRFAEGLTEDLLTTLGTADLTAMRLLAPTSAVRVAAEPHLAGSSDGFGIDLLLMGRVQREVGGYKVTAQLVEARSSAVRWSGENRQSTSSSPVADSRAASWPWLCDGFVRRRPSR